HSALINPVRPSCPSCDSIVAVSQARSASRVRTAILSHARESARTHARTCGLFPPRRCSQTAARRIWLTSPYNSCLGNPLVPQCDICPRSAMLCCSDFRRNYGVRGAAALSDHQFPAVLAFQRHGLVERFDGALHLVVGRRL